MLQDAFHGLRATHKSVRGPGHDRMHRPHLKANGLLRIWSRYPRGARGTVLTAIFLAILVLALNIAILAVGYYKHGSMRLGSCSKTNQMFTATHLLINVLSTLLLASSNTCCQILAAPTRAAVDKAHELGKSLRLGTFSMRNIQGVGRKITVAILALSSLPLHFFYNSVIANKISVYQYGVLWAWDDGHGGQSFGSQWIMPDVSYPVHIEDADFTNTTSPTLAQEHIDAGNVTQLPWDQCLNQISDGLTTNYSVIIPVLSLEAEGDSVRTLGVADLSRFQLEGQTNLKAKVSWTCSHNQSYDCDFYSVDEFLTAGAWQYKFSDESTQAVAKEVYGITSRCYAIKANEYCSIEFNQALLMVVIACNIAKLVCFIVTLRMIDKRPLLTIGDAISSFLAEPCNNSTTAGYGRYTQFLYSERSYRSPNAVQHKFKGIDAVSRLRGVFTIGLCMFWLIGGIVVVLAASLAIGTGVVDFNFFSSSSKTQAVDYTSPFGNLASNSETKVLFTAILLINIPQFAVSLFYVFYNSMYTNMQTAIEYTRFAHLAKPLRVTFPIGSQRTTYWLQLPYQYSIPFTATMATLHWLVSETYHLVYIGTRDVNQRVVSGSTIITADFDLGAGILALALSYLLILFLIFSAMRNHGSNMKVLVSDSQALSLVCQRAADEDASMVEKPLLYGCREDVIDEHGNPFVGFTSKLEDVKRIDPEPRKSWSWKKVFRIKTRRSRKESADPEKIALRPIQSNSNEDSARSDDGNAVDLQSKGLFSIRRKPVPTVVRIDSIEQADIEHGSEYPTMPLLSSASSGAGSRPNELEEDTESSLQQTPSQTRLL